MHVERMHKFRLVKHGNAGIGVWVMVAVAVWGLVDLTTHATVRRFDGERVTVVFTPVPARAS